MPPVRGFWIGEAVSTFLEERACPVCGKLFLMIPIAPPYVACAYCTRPPERSASSSNKQIDLPIGVSPVGGTKTERKKASTT